MSSNPKHVNVMVPSKSIPISGISRTHSELEIAQAELLADYRDDLMYERILTGILRRCDRKGTCHPKTITSIENIISTKMLDYGSTCEHRSYTDEDWFIGDKSEPIHSLPVRELTRHKVVSVTSFCSSSALENETLDTSMSIRSCFLTTQSSSVESEAAQDNIIESGIFELEL